KDRIHDSNGGIARKWALATKHFIKDDTERENIGRLRCFASSNLLGRHIVRSSHDDTWPGVWSLKHCDAASGGWFFQFSQAEVENLYAAIGCYKDVFRFEIPVHDALGVRCGQAVCDLDGISQHSPRSECALFQLRAQLFAFE